MQKEEYKFLFKLNISKLGDYTLSLIMNWTELTLVLLSKEP